MKKQLLALSALTLALMYGSAMAAHGDVQFTGVVTNTTCDVNPGVGGAVNNLVQLGTAAPGGQGSIVNFSLKPDMTQAGCTGLTGANTVTITWNGPFDANGLTAQSGAATDAWTEITHTNATGTAVTIDATSLSSSISGDEFIANGGDGATFTAQLNAGNNPGDYVSAAAYIVAYN
ncbi:fimbrial protein PefA [Citrobacter freundii]|nr:fimbrial protein PefA [Citrobacter freundii]MBC6509537.1 fimbrial protein PefA [Citrobacter freundii]